MKINFNKIKYIFILFYLLLIISILLLSKSFNLRDIGSYLIIFIFAIMLVLVFIPIKYKKIGYYKYKKCKIIPIIIFSLMFAILIVSINYTLAEFFGGNYQDIISYIFDNSYFYIIPLIIWVIFAFIGIIINTKKEVDNIYKKYLITLISGSLLELIITVPLHIIIIKRGGCFAGIYSLFGIIGGFFVLVFVMGPSIFLFLIYFYKKFNN